MKKSKFVITANPNPCRNNPAQRIRHFYSFNQAIKWVYEQVIKNNPIAKYENVKNRLTHAIYNNLEYADWRWHIFYIDS